ncbi:MAG: hypothetical protein WKF83_16815 [Nocardioidaceae bacterium]
MNVEILYGPVANGACIGGGAAVLLRNGSIAGHDALFHSNGDYNLGSFDESAVDAAIDRIKRLPIEEQAAAWGALDQTMMAKHHPAIIIGYGKDAIPHSSKLGA